VSFLLRADRSANLPVMLTAEHYMTLRNAVENACGQVGRLEGLAAMIELEESLSLSDKAELLGLCWMYRAGDVLIGDP
jgi:hypothetical protein